MSNSPGCPPPILSIAGSDCSAGAGIQADLKSIFALGGYGLTAITSVVSETPGRVSMIRMMDEALIRDQMEILLSAFPIKAAKTGMLGGEEQVRAVADIWGRLAQDIPLVVDPVMVATSGGKLLLDSAIEALCDHLLPLATLITPNMDEAEVLWHRPVKNRSEMEACARDLADRFQTNILVKGGHLQEDKAADVACLGGVMHWFEVERTPRVNTHGTGCTYSAAIATALGLGLDLHQAIARAKRYVTGAIANHHAWTFSQNAVHALNHSVMA
jgi:hydroxymethylpyrimidine/phosphomethylpyrimidine kinase